MKLKRFVVYPNNGSSYNRQGIIFPSIREIDIEAEIKRRGGKRIEWVSNFRWIRNHDREVLTFYSDWGAVAAMTVVLYDYPLQIRNAWETLNSYFKRCNLTPNQARMAFPFLIKKDK